MAAVMTFLNNSIVLQMTCVNLWSLFIWNNYASKWFLGSDYIQEMGLFCEANKNSLNKIRNTFMYNYCLLKMNCFTPSTESDLKVYFRSCHIPECVGCISTISLNSGKKLN